jgi:chorismate mutase
MTKQEELNTLRATAHTLGADSYLGPWLDSVADELEALILADLQPRLTLADAIAKAREVTDEAEREAATRIETATRHAALLEAKAEKRWEKISTVLYDAARLAIRELNEH